MARLILAHDLGTTGNKATLFDEAGGMVGSAFGGYPVSFPLAGPRQILSGNVLLA